MFITPALSLYLAAKTKNLFIIKWVLILFITFFGSTIILENGTDGYVHLQNVHVHYSNLSFSTFWQEMVNMFMLKANSEIQEEPFIHIISYFVGSIIKTPGLFFVIVAFIYAYFFVGSMIKIFKFFPKFKTSKLFFGFAILLIMWKNIDALSSVRTYTGMWILVYACISYYQTKKKKYALLMFVPPLIHIGFGVMAMPAWFVLFAGNRTITYSVIFALSFITTIINPQAAMRQLQQTEVGASKVESYEVDDLNEYNAKNDEKYGDSTWYKRLAIQNLQSWSIAIIAFVLILTRAYLNKMTYLEKSLFSVGLLTIALSNSSWFIYALSNRSGIVGSVFILCTLMLMWQRGYFNRKSFLTKKLELRFLQLAFAVAIPFLIYRLASMIYYWSVYLLFVPFVPWFNEDLNVSIRQAIGNLF